VAHDIFKEFWDTFKGLGSWQEKLMKGYYQDGFVENFFGRRRRYPMTRNEAINFPIQSSASEIVVDAMTRLSQMALDTDTPYLHPVLNIHDDLTFCIPDNEDIIDEAIEVITTEMLRLPYDFVNVPMAVEVSIGTNWENLEDIVKIWTTDTGRHSAKDKARFIGKR
jgi:DNA polymerase I-like protein with 3'-5' exonuclease and polymerase domains